MGEWVGGDSISHLVSRSPRDRPKVPAGTKPALQRPGRVREPAEGTWTGQGGENPLCGSSLSAELPCLGLGPAFPVTNRNFPSPGSPKLLHSPLRQAVVKALDQLAQQGKIKEKTYGKQKIYFADQVRTRAD